MGAISIFDIAAVRDQLALAAPRPIGKVLFSVLARSAGSDVTVAGVKLSPWLKLVCRLTEGQRYRLALFLWLRPDPPCPGLEDIEAIRKDACLTDVDRGVFLKRLRDDCRELMRVQPRLANWLQLRVGLLDWALTPMWERPEEIEDSQVVLRTLLTRANHLHWQTPREAQRLASLIVRNAMEGAALALASAVGNKGEKVSANLMAPVQATGPLFMPGNAAAANANERAEALWEGIDAEHRLLIVAETRDSNHLGFWIPIARGEGGNPLPGAGSAFLRGDGDTVFKDDLPPFQGFPAKVEARWRSFMVEQFQEKLFVSIPFRAPNGTAGSRITPGVLNVNVDAVDTALWRRAYHPEWLRLARREVQPFIEIALSALLIMLAGVDDPPSLDTGSDAWDRLPVVVPKLMEMRGTS